MSVSLITDFRSPPLARAHWALEQPPVKRVRRAAGQRGRKPDTAPDQRPAGSARWYPWTAWTADYAGARHGGQSLLQGEGDLLDSITFDVQGDRVEIGSNLVYARIHQEGGVAGMAPGPAAIPARPYLGLSSDNLAELQVVAGRWLDQHLEQR